MQKGDEIMKVEISQIKDMPFHAILSIPISDEENPEIYFCTGLDKDELNKILIQVMARISE